MKNVFKFELSENMQIKNDYAIIKEILKEGMYDNVFIVKNVKEDQQYAAKILNWEEKFDWTEQNKLLQNSNKFITLEHPAISKFKGINFKSLKDQSKLKPTIITEYYPTGTLKECLKNQEKSGSQSSFSFTKKYIMLLEFLMECVLHISMKYHI